MEKYLLNEKVLYYYEVWKTISDLLGVNEQSYLIRLFGDDGMKTEIIQGKSYYFTISGQVYLARKVVEYEFFREEAIKLEGLSMFNEGKRVTGRIFIMRDGKRIWLETQSDINNEKKEQYEITDVKCKIGGYQKGEEHFRNRYDPKYDKIFNEYSYESSESSSSSTDWESSSSSFEWSSDSDDMFETKLVSKKPY